MKISPKNPEDEQFREILAAMLQGSMVVKKKVTKPKEIKPVVKRDYIGSKIDIYI